MYVGMLMTAKGKKSFAINSHLRQIRLEYILNSLLPAAPCALIFRRISCPFDYRRQIFIVNHCLIL